MSSCFTQDLVYQPLMVNRFSSGF